MRLNTRGPFSIVFIILNMIYANNVLVIKEVEMPTSKNYPSGVDTFRTWVDDVDTIVAASVNDVQDQIVAIETVLGTNPQGTLTDLKTRLAVSINNDGTLKTSTQFKNATSVTLNNGTTSSTVSDLQTINDGNAYDVTESSGTPGLDLEVNFTSVTSIKKIYVKAYYVKP
jgi:hypothetical protein